MKSNANPALLKTIAQAEMRKINRSAVLEYLRLSATASRSEIADRLKLSRPSVKRIIDQLIEEGFVIPTGQKEIGRGRSRELLSLNSTGNAVIGIDIGGSHIRGSLVNIGGEILIDHHQEQQWAGADENFILIQAFIHNMLEKSQSENHHLLGIGVGIPGIIAAYNGSVTLAPSLDWINYPFLEKIQPDIDVPIYVENDVAQATLGEYWFGVGIGKRNLVMIAVGTGIGAGIIIEGNLYRGHTNSAGEIGYFLPGLAFLKNKYPGFGALEGRASGKGIADRAREILTRTQPDRLLSKIDTPNVIEASRNGEHWAQELIEETIDYYSLMVANVSLCFDPELIILGGGLAESFDLLFNPIVARLNGVIPNIPLLKRSKLQANAPILGAVTQVFQKVTDYSVVHIA